MQKKIVGPDGRPIVLVDPLKKTRVIVGMPMYSGISARCLVAFTDFLRRMAHSPRFSCEATYNAGTYLDQNREQISDEAIKKDFDYLFFIDSDMVFPPSVLDRLYDRNKDVVGGVYSLRAGVRHGPCMYVYRKKEGDFNQFKKWPLNKCIKVGGIGTGMLLIKVEALKRIPYPRFAYMEAKMPDKEGNPRRLGEDLSFCVRCHENGIKIYADTSMMIGHEGVKTWTYKDFQWSQIIEKEKLKNIRGMTAA